MAGIILGGQGYLWWSGWCDVARRQHGGHTSVVNASDVGMWLSGLVRCLLWFVGRLGCWWWWRLLVGGVVAQHSHGG